MFTFTRPAHILEHTCMPAHTHTHTHTQTNAVAFARDGYDSRRFCSVVWFLTDKDECALFYKVNKNLARKSQRWYIST